MDTIRALITDLPVNWTAILKGTLKTLLIVLMTLVAMRLLRRLLGQLERRLIKESVQEGEPPSESRKRVETLMRLVRQALYIALWAVAAMIVLNQLGVAIGPIIAGAGVFGLALGFGAQNLVRDIIAGFFIIMENQIRVGDVAIINGTGGLVDRINFRTTVLRDLSGVVHIFPNGSITSLSNMTKEWSAYVFEIGVAYKENTDHVIEIMKKVGQELKADPINGPLMLEEPEIFGVDKFADSAVVIKGRVRTKPVRQWAVGREYLRRIKLAFDEHGIEIPFPHQTLYFGEKSKPIDLQLFDRRDTGNPAPTP